MRRTLILAAAVLLTGCGASSENDLATSVAATTPADGSADEQAIRATITSLAREPDPDLCEEAITQRFLDQAYPPAGEGALEACRVRQKPAYKLEAEGVRFESLEVTGDQARAAFELIGPGVEGTLRTVALVRSAAGAWQVDELERAEIVDRELFDRSLRASATNGPGGLSDPQAECLVRESTAISDSALERRAVSENHNLPVSIVASCVGGGSAVDAVGEIIRRTLVDDPDYGAFGGCAARRVADELSLEDAGAFLRSEERDLVRELTAKALAACGAGGGAGPPEQSLT